MGGCAVSKHLSDKSFLRRAEDHLRRSEAKLTWESGESTSNSFEGIDAEDLIDAPHVQYRRAMDRGHPAASFQEP